MTDEGLEHLSAQLDHLGVTIMQIKRERDKLRAENARLKQALQSIANLVDSEAGEPLDDAIEIARAALWDGEK